MFFISVHHKCVIDRLLIARTCYLLTRECVPAPTLIPQLDRGPWIPFFSFCLSFFTLCLGTCRRISSATRFADKQTTRLVPPSTLVSFARELFLGRLRSRKEEVVYTESRHRSCYGREQFCGRVKGHLRSPHCCLIARDRPSDTVRQNLSTKKWEVLSVTVGRTACPRRRPESCSKRVDSDAPISEAQSTDICFALKERRLFIDSVTKRDPSALISIL